MDVGVWLRGLGLEQYETAFRTHAVDGAILPRLDADDLKDLGVVAVGHRRLLLDAIAALCAAAPAPPALPRAETIEGGRRQVSVLFADIAGYTRLSTEIDAEDLHALRKDFTDAVDGVVRAHGGSIERHVGDSVMGVFGAPVAHDNDPERAVLAALATRDAMAPLSMRMGRDVGVHIGVASGEVVTTGGDADQAFTVTGETVNLASRLTSAAQAGEIFVSAAVHRALSDRLEASPVANLAAKGFAEPVTAWRVAALHRANTEAGQRFVGRQSELRQLGAAIEACRETGRGQAIHVRGEPGIGKTRLVNETKSLALSQGLSCHEGLVLDFGAGTGRDAVRSIVRSLTGAAPDADQATLEAAALATHASGALDERRSVFLNDLLGLPQSLEQRAVYDALGDQGRSGGRRQTAVELMTGLARRQPALIVVEDLHWADAKTLQGIAALAAAASECPVLVLMTSRLEGDPVARGWRVDGPLLTIDLAPLRREDAIALAHGFRTAASGFTERCVARAAGNPLFLEQLLRNADELSGSSVPDSVQSLVQARMDKLDPGDRRALQIASIFGQHFSLAAVRALLEAPTYDPRDLAAHFLIRPQGEDFLFGHALIRDAVYGTLLRSRRRDLHRLAARWFETRDLTLRAEHVEKAGDPDAAAAFLAAAREQASQYRYERALALAEQGLALALERGDRFALTACRGEILLDLGRISEAGTAHEAACAMAGDDAERCRALLGLAAVKRITDDLDGALAAVDQALEGATRLGLVPEESRGHFLRGNLMFFRGDMDACLSEHRRSFELAREDGSPELEAAALGGLGDAEYMRGRMLTAGEHFRRCVEISERHGLGRIEVANRPMAAIASAFVGDMLGAVDASRAAIAAAVRVGHQRAEAIAHHAAFFCCRSLQDFETGHVHVERALALARQLGSRRFEAEALAFRGELGRLAGEQVAGRRDLEESLAISRETGLAYIGPFILGLAGRAATNAGERQAALAEGEALLETNQMGHNQLMFRREAIDTCLEAGDFDEADRHAACLERFAAAEPSPWTRFLVARGHALAAAGRGSRDAGLPAALESLLEEARRRGFRDLASDIPPALARLRKAGVP